jgi:hypothetical protein
VNFIILLKNYFKEGFKILFIMTTMMNNVLIFTQETSNQIAEGNYSSYILNQAINFLPEANCTKPHLKLLTESFAEKFHSCEYCLAKPSSHTKSITIICESISESNSRNSSFLIAELTTST